MNPHVSLFTALGLSALALVGCHHAEGEATTPPSAAVAPASEPPADASAPDRSAASVDASPAPNDAAPLAAPAPDASAPAPAAADLTAAPPYPPSALHEAFSKAEPKLVACYLPGKKRDPKLRGKVIVKLTIQADGAARPVTNEGSNLPDPEVVACVIRTVKTIRFTRPVEGSVTVVYPFIFHPTGDATLILQDVDKP